MTETLVLPRHKLTGSVLFDECHSGYSLQFDFAIGLNRDIS